MSRLLFTVLFSLLTFSLAAQTCCEATKAFANLSDDQAFRDEHQLPAAYQLEDPSGMMITLSVENGMDAQAYHIAAKRASNTYILVFHEWWGLNDHIKREAEQLHEAFPSANILALDLYDGKVATTREEASALMKANESDRSLRIIQAAADYAGKEATFGTIGWCFGGGWSLQAALALGDQVEACVMYYGMPVREAEQLQPLQAPVLGIFAEQDGWINREVVGEFENAMEAANKMVSVHWYDAQHAFANPSNAQFDEAATEDAWNKTIQFLQAHLF